MQGKCANPILGRDLDCLPAQTKKQAMILGRGIGLCFDEYG